MTTCAAPEAVASPEPRPGPDAVSGGGAGGGGGGGGGDVVAHRVLGFARAVDAALADLAEVPVWSMSTEEQREALRVLDRVGSRLAELDLRVLAAADRNEVGADSGATSTAAWLAHQTHQTRPRCSAAVRLAVNRPGFRGGRG